MRALARIIDAKMLDKLKALHATGFKLVDKKVDEAKWKGFEDEIRGRHSADELEALKRHGFSGVVP